MSAEDKSRTSCFGGDWLECSLSQRAQRERAGVREKAKPVPTAQEARLQVKISARGIHHLASH
jgi:hypothetical protein